MVVVCQSLCCMNHMAWIILSSQQAKEDSVTSQASQMREQEFIEVQPQNSKGVIN